MESILIKYIVYPEKKTDYLRGKLIVVRACFISLDFFGKEKQLYSVRPSVRLFRVFGGLWFNYGQAKKFDWKKGITELSKKKKKKKKKSIHEWKK